MQIQHCVRRFRFHLKEPYLPSCLRTPLFFTHRLLGSVDLSYCRYFVFTNSSKPSYLNGYYQRVNSACTVRISKEIGENKLNEMEGALIVHHKSCTRKQFVQNEKGRSGVNVICDDFKQVGQCQYLSLFFHVTERLALRHFVLEFATF